MLGWSCISMCAKVKLRNCAKVLSAKTMVSFYALVLKDWLQLQQFKTGMRFSTGPW